jgi:putative zinc finger protein
MTHPREALSAYLDGELREDERRAVDLHLAACPSCARELEELASLDALARDAVPPEAPAGYFDDLPSRVRARIRAPRRRTSPLWLVPLAAGVMVAVLAPQVLRDRAAQEQPAKDDAPRAQAPAPAATLPEADAAKTVEQAPMPQRVQPTAREPKREEAAPLAKQAPPATVAVREELRARDDAVRAPFAAPPPAAPAAAKEDDRQAKMAGLGYTAGSPPAPGAMADAAAPAEAELGAGAPAQNRAVTAGGRLSSDAKAKNAGADEGFLEAGAIPLDTVASARRARDAWRRYVAAHPASDEARVRLVEAAAAVYRASGDEADRDAAVREADAYLARGAAPGAERVRAARRALQR